MTSTDEAQARDKESPPQSRKANESQRWNAKPGLQLSVPFALHWGEGNLLPGTKFPLTPRPLAVSSPRPGETQARPKPSPLPHPLLLHLLEGRLGRRPLVQAAPLLLFVLFACSHRFQKFRLVFVLLLLLPGKADGWETVSMDQRASARGPRNTLAGQRKGCHGPHRLFTPSSATPFSFRGPFWTCSYASMAPACSSVGRLSHFLFVNAISVRTPASLLLDWLTW